jgi:hypothetical protein
LIKNKIIEKIKNSIKIDNKELIEKNYLSTEYEDYIIHFFCVGNNVVWKDFVLNLFEKSIIEFEKNRNINELMSTRFPSFIITKDFDEEIYLITAGQGNAIVNNMRDMFFGVEILSKIIGNDSPVIKNIYDNKVSGLRNTEKFMNRINHHLDTNKIILLFIQI